MLTYYLGLGSNKQEVRLEKWNLYIPDEKMVHFLHPFFASQIYPFYFICNTRMQI